MATNAIRRAVPAILPLFLGLTLAGCRSAYDVTVRNLTDQPVTAKLDVPFGDGAPQHVTQRYLGPGQRGNLFVQTDYNVHVSLSVDSASNVGYPATLDLTRGQTVVNVLKSDAPGRLQLETVAHP